MINTAQLKKWCHSFTQVDKNAPSVKDIFHKLDYFSMWVKMFWNGWYGFIVADDIMDVIDGKGRTEYMKHKAGKYLQNPSLISYTIKEEKGNLAKNVLGSCDQ